MRLKKHFTDQPDKKTIDKGKKWLSKKYNIPSKFLEFQFQWDVSKFGAGVQLHFEVRDPKDERFGSTLSYKI